jgi:hypothetical protein
MIAKILLTVKHSNSKLSMPSVLSKPLYPNKVHSAQLAVTKTVDGLTVEGVYNGDKFKVTMKIYHEGVEVLIESRNGRMKSEILQDVMLSLEASGIMDAARIIADSRYRATAADPST